MKSKLGLTQGGLAPENANGKMQGAPARGIPTLLDPLRAHKRHEPGPRPPFELGSCFQPGTPPPPPALAAGDKECLSEGGEGKSPAWVLWNQFDLDFPMVFLARGSSQTRISAQQNKHFRPLAWNCSARGLQSLLQKICPPKHAAAWNACSPCHYGRLCSICNCSFSILLLLDCCMLVYFLLFFFCVFVLWCVVYSLRVFFSNLGPVVLLLTKFVPEGAPQKKLGETCRAWDGQPQQLRPCLQKARFVHSPPNKQQHICQ